MSPSPVPPTTLRIALFDPENSVPDWQSVLALGQPIQVVRCTSVGGLSEAAADVAVVCSSSAGVPNLLGQVAASKIRIPLTLLTAADAQDHPMARLMRALVKAKAEWQAAFDALTDPVALLDANGTVVRANLGFARSLGRAIREVLGQTVGELLGAASDPASEPVARTLADGRPRTGEVTYANVDGPHLASLSPLPPDEEGRTGFVLLMKDLSEQKQQQQSLMRSARLADVGQLAAGVAHEINTPLASVALRAESLLRSTEDPSLRDLPAFRNFARYLRTIGEEVFRCKKIVRALLDFSSQQEPEKKPVDLNNLVNGAAELVGHEVRLRQVRLERHLDNDLPTVPADAGQLRQVLVALLMNALDASSPGGSIRVATSRIGSGHVVLAVEDDGAGIPREVQDKIWSPFFSTKPFGEATGLGLAISHGIVTAHGGSIELDSEPGRGTRIRVLLPEPIR